MHESTLDRLARWAKSQCDPWRDMPLADLDALRRHLEGLEAASPSVFLFDFAAGVVSLRSKSVPNAEGAAPELLRRARLYLALFRDVLTGFDLDCRFPLAIDVDDHPSGSSGAPVFAFQKLTGSPLILLPDVDILGSDFFLSPEFDDPFALDQKADAAIFVGATTGYDLTREAVETLAMPRLRSAVFFRDAPDVIFRLPKIVQYDTEETADMVRALGVSGSPTSWKDQFGYKYLLSMDGNGATCSRVAIALKSHSVLIKYASDFQLFYFDGLRPGENLLSLSRDEELGAILEACRSHPARTAAIAQAGRRFAREHLSRLPVMSYVALLLDAYSRTVLKQPGPRSAGHGSSDIRSARPLVDAHGHVQNVGDVRSPLGGWLGSIDGENAIEGFALEPGPGVEPHDIRYQAVLSDGDLSRPCSGYEFCGTRGLNQGLRGVCISLEGVAAAEYDLSYLAAFGDGSLVGPVTAGTLCSSPGAVLIGLQLLITLRC